MVICSFIFVLCFLSVKLNIPFLSVLFLFSRSFYFPGHNSCIVRYFGGANIFLFIYLIFFLSFILAFLLRIIQPKKSLRRLSVLNIFSIFFIILSFQTFQQHQYFLAYMKSFYGKSLDEKYNSIFGYSYRFARFCRQHLSGHHQGKMLTDYSFNKNLELYAVAYYLYPAVYIPQTQNDVYDCLILFNKKDAVKNVPSDFKVLAVFDEFSLLAVKIKEL